ncbi:MAG: 4-carboxy-4-hydroxy-2-oxoadipate aldolase/oxaloacetate decarboxylase [Betaproteobacteria bacterium]|nr:4-carboxy-4-hydroxy-2-oxoadipate aldolase/oxaloacetate decarboxylase [Betaproteobacteria bacterium]
MYGHIIHDVPRPPQGLVEQFRGIWTSTLGDTMGRHGIMMPEIRPIYEEIGLVGVAFTVLNYPNDNITTHKALHMVQPGDVLVIDEGRDNNTGAFGHNMSLQARNRGVAGLVTNGCVRDVRLLRKERFPVFCRGVCPRSAQKNTPGAINVPVQLGGLVVQPGDIVVGDDDGVAVVPLAIADEVLRRAKERMDMEHQQARDIREGKKPLEILFGDDWVDAALKGKVKEVKSP